MLKIFQAQTEWEIEQVRGLWREFAEFLKDCFF